MATALLLVVGSMLLGLFWQPDSLGQQASWGERLRFALACDLLIMAFFAFSVGYLARHRFQSPRDIGGAGLGPGSDHGQKLQAIVQNNHEQTSLAVMSHMVFAMIAPPSWLILIPIAVVQVLIGRILFWRRYAKGASARSLGFALSFYSSVAMLIVSGAILLGSII